MRIASPRRPHRASRSGVIVISAAVVLLGAGCSSVGTNASSGSGTGGGGTAALQDAFGTPASADEVKKGGKLVVALSAEPDQLDPTLSRSLYSRYVFSAMCEKLYDVDAQVHVVPQLASALPKTSDGGRTITIPVRDGITFADGTPFNAQAVKATLERDLTLEGSGRKSELGPIASIEAPDATTVVVHYKEPFAPLTAALADRAGMIMSPKATKALGKNFASHPVCVGPFKFAKRVPSNSIDLVKDPNYYNADKVYLDAISYQIITDSNIRAANLRSGDAVVADTLSTQSASDLRTDKSISVLRSQSLGYQGVTFNVGNVDGVGTPAKKIDRPTAADARVRKAFEYAIDRKGLVKAVFNDLYAVACSPISPKSEFSSPEAQTCTPHDPEKSKQLLQQAGVTTPYQVTMLASNNPDTLRLAQALQSMVKEGGFDLKIQPVEYASLLDQQDRGDFELLQLGWSGRIDPDANITNFVGTGGSQNVSGYNNPDVDQILQQARQAQSLDERRKFYAEAVTMTEKDAPIIYLYRQSNLTGVSDKVKGVQVFADGVVRVAFAGFAK
jgi:peptide/nickel transport system substrate-binding protein